MPKDVQLRQILRDMLAGESFIQGEFVRVIPDRVPVMGHPSEYTLTFRRYHRDLPAEEIVVTLQELLNLITED